VRRAVIEAKFHGVTELLAPLARRMAEFMEPSWFGGLLVPVPLAQARRRSRGFNQAEIIAREVARTTGNALAGDAVRRVRDTPAQAELSARQRADNLSDAFSADSVLHGATVILVDDVITTGATISHVAAACRAAGAAHAHGLSIARED
jgi:ComF family protein